MKQRQYESNKKLLKELYNDFYSKMLQMFSF